MIKSHKKKRIASKKEDRSLAVSATTKLYLMAEAHGLCSNPDCENKLYVMGVLEGECAHILPEAKNFVREDDVTPLKERNKKENLIYLCKGCHKRIDTKEFETIYTKDLLLSWKSDHIGKVQRISKNASYLSDDIKKTLQKELSKISDNSSSSFQVIQQLLEICKNLVHNNKLDEASIILGQITALNAFKDNKEIQEDITILNARIAIKNEKIDFAKSLLLNLLKKNPDNIEALYRYIDICSSTPEVSDEKDKYLPYFQTKCPEHSKHQYWKIIEYLKTPKDNSVLDKYPIPDFSKIATEFQEDFYSTYCIFLYRKQLIAEANKLFEAWSNNFPSSNIILFKQFICKTENAILFNSKNNPDTEIINDALIFANQHKETVFSNLSHRQKTIWDYCELTLKINLFVITGSNTPEEEIINELFDNLLKCYFDQSIDFNLTNILLDIRIGTNLVKKIIEKLIVSNILPSKNLINRIFLNTIMVSDLDEIVSKLLLKIQNSNLINLKNAVKAADKDKILENLNLLEDDFLSLHLIHILENKELKLYLLENIKCGDNERVDVQYNILGIYIENDDEIKASELINNIPFDNVNYFALEKISDFLWENKKWHLFNLITKKMLSVITDDKQKAHLIAMLAQSYYHIGDYAQFEENALKSVNENSHFLGRNIENSVTLLMDYYVTVKKQDKYKVKELYEIYKNTDRQPIFFLMASRNLLAVNEYDASKEALFTALYKEKHYTREIFHDIFFVANELNNLEKHKINLQIVTEGVFVKLSSLDEWFYIGSDEYAVGAVSCEINDNNYNALINKKIGKQVERSANRYNPDINETIQLILSPIQYINFKGTESIQHFASVGKHGIFSITVPDINGEFDFERLISAIADIQKPENEFLDEFVSKPYPFSFLCQRFGGLASARSKIYQEQKGYIRFNDSTINTYHKHQDISQKVLNGQRFYADALSILMFIETGLLDDVINNCNGFKTTPAVIKELSNTLNHFRHKSNTNMRISYAQNRLFLSEEKNTGSFASKLQDAIIKLNNKLPNETILASASINSVENDIENIIPNYFLEPLKISIEDECFLLTDDGYLCPTLELFKYNKLPACFSSVSLIWSMWNKQLIDTKKYLTYFLHVSNCRYYHLNISVDDVHKAIFPVKNGTYSYSLNNMDWFDFHVTLSKNYTNPQAKLNFICCFFQIILTDDTIFDIIAKEIFNKFIKQTFSDITHTETKEIIKINLENYIKNQFIITQETLNKKETLFDILNTYHKGLIIL
jgi:hypothetical protein